MTDLAFVLDQLHREQRDDPWHGPSMAAVLERIDAARAAAHPLAGVHSIWEMVLHVTAWSAEVARRLRTGIARDPEAGDWPAVPARPDAGAWQAALDALRAAQDDLRRAIEAFPHADLDRMVDDVRDPALGTGVTYRQMLHGLVQHDVYHSGQMTLLAKVLRTDP